MAKTPAKTSAAKKAPMKKRKPLKPDADGVVRLSGGNPQIAKGDGDAVVVLQALFDEMAKLGVRPLLPPAG